MQDKINVEKFIQIQYGMFKETVIQTSLLKMVLDVTNRQNNRPCTSKWFRCLIGRL